MDFKQIQELIRLVNESNIGEVSIEQKDFKITVRQKQEQVTQYLSAAPQQMMQAPPSQMQGQQASQSAAPTTDKPASETPAASNLLTIKSPMIGTFYRRPAPDKPNYVEVGEEVSPGKVVCVIEAMKLFNDIESEVKGRIVKVLVEDASPVEYDQPLFLVEPH
jgi:acetyl-CoA carboxylase biotin carboxyl carrier protein